MMRTLSRRRLIRLILPLILLLVIVVLVYSNHHSESSAPSALPAPSETTHTQAPVISEDPTTECHAHGVLPDPICTPGAIDPNVTQANIEQTICKTGYTKTVRPPVSYTNKLKAQQMASYGFTDSIHLHEEDHLISLELGGDPINPKNLWPEPHQSPNPKDKVENFLHAAVCSGRITLSEAQNRIATDWTTAEEGIKPS